jgi:hypothetical protein
MSDNISILFVDALGAADDVATGRRDGLAVSRGRFMIACDRETPPTF